MSYLPVCPDPLSVIATAKITARKLGYAIGVHGSLARDIDLIAVPWTDNAVPAQALAEAIRDNIGGFFQEGAPNPTLKPHGRKAWNICYFGEGIHFAVVDLSVMPIHSAGSDT